MKGHIMPLDYPDFLTAVHLLAFIYFKLKFPTV